MDISRHICNYLSSNPAVIVPGLGRFTATDKPAEIRGDTIIPPSRTVVYNSSEDEDDGVLTAYIAQQENITIEQAKSETEEFYNMLKRKLAGRKAIMLNKLGTLTVNEVGDIVFEPDANLFIKREDSYGLDRVDLKAETTTQFMPPPMMPPITPPIQTPPPPAPTPAQEPAKTETTTSTASAPESAESDESLFADRKMRVRENTDRPRPASERQAPPVKPPVMTPPPSSEKARTQKKKTNAGNGFPAWVILVLVLAAALGVGFYFFYPKVSPYVDSAIASIKGEKKPAEKQPERDLPPTETESEVPDPEVAQTLDSSTDKKTALNPGGESPSQQAKPAQTSTPSQAKPATSTQPVKTQPATSTYSQGSVGSGKYLLIAGSFTTRSRAEAFGQQSLQPAAINYEIIDFGNERFRVAVASFDNQTEAYNQAEIFKSKPHCENVWVLKR